MTPASSSGGGLRIGVIGVGHLGSHHARILHSLAACTLTGVYDTNEQKNAETASRCSLGVCSSMDELLSRVDAVTICTPTESHFPIAEEAIRRGLHVFVEKPLCATNEEAQALADYARSAGVMAAVGHIERFNPAVQSVRERIGRPRFIEAHRLNQFSPRGLATDVVLELMIHDIDLARWLVGAEPVEIRAAGVPVLSPTDDIANCRLAFPDGCVANLTASRISANPMRKIRIFSQDHYTSIDLAAKSLESYRLFSTEESDLPPGYHPLVEAQGRRLARWTSGVAASDALEAELSDFRDAIRDRRPPRVDLDEGARSLRVALAVAQACREAQIASAIALTAPAHAAVS